MGIETGKRTPSLNAQFGSILQCRLQAQIHPSAHHPPKIPGNPTPEKGPEKKVNKDEGNHLKARSMRGKMGHIP